MPVSLRRVTFFAFPAFGQVAERAQVPCGDQQVTVENFGRQVIVEGCLQFDQVFYDFFWWFVNEF